MSGTLNQIIIPEKLSNPLIKKSQNCYMYFRYYKNPKVKNKCLKLCKKKRNNNSSCYTKKANTQEHLNLNQVIMRLKKALFQVKKEFIIVIL